MLLLVILYGRSPSHAVPAHCPLVLPWEKFVPMKKGGCHRYPTPAPLPSHRQIDSDVQKRLPSMILFTCLIGLKWVAGRRRRVRLWEGGRVRVIGGDTGRGVLLKWGARAIGVQGWQVEKKKKHSHLTSLLHPSMGAPCEQSNEVQITTRDCWEQASIVRPRGTLNECHSKQRGTDRYCTI